MASTISNNGMYLIINSGSGTAIDLNNGGGNNGTKVQGWHPAWNSGKIQNQAWIFVDQGNSYWKLFNKAGGSCMDLDNGSKGNGTPIQGWGSTNTDAQLWKFEQVGDRNGMPAAWK